MAKAAAADLAAAIMLSLLMAGCGKPAPTAGAALLTPPPASRIPPDYEAACATALANARILAPMLAAANVGADLNLKLISPGPRPRLSCPIAHNDDQGAVAFELDCQDPANTVCVTVIFADLGGERVYQNNSQSSHPPSPGLQSLDLGASN
jgi:hypothetical protein